MEPSNNYLANLVNLLFNYGIVDKKDICCITSLYTNAITQ